MDVIWFHTFEGVNNSTLTETWQAFLSDVGEVAKKPNIGSLKNKVFIFHACVVRQRFSVERKLVINPNAQEKGKVVAILGPNYVVSRENLISFEANDGWNFHLGPELL